MPPLSSPTQRIRRSRPRLHRRSRLLRAATLSPLGLRKLRTPRHLTKPLKRHRLFRNLTRSTIVPIHFTCPHLHPPSGGGRASFVPLRTSTKVPSYLQIHLRRPHPRALLLRVSSLRRFLRSVKGNERPANVWVLPRARNCSPVGDW